MQNIKYLKLMHCTRNVIEMYYTFTNGNSFSPWLQCSAADSKYVDLAAARAMHINGDEMLDGCLLCDASAC